MSSAARLILYTPIVEDPAAVAPALSAACAAGGVAAAIVRFAATDERSLVTRIKALAPAVQGSDVAFIVAAAGSPDPVQAAVRGGADGIHVAAAAPFAEYRQRLKDASLGVGDLRSRDEAMRAGEAGADYLLFGEPRPDGSLPPAPAVLERATWWADIFEVPCVVFAPSLAAVGPAAATGAEFVALGEWAFAYPAGPAAAVREASACALAAAPSEAVRR